MLPIERIAYSAIKDRPRLVLPDGARIAVWVIVNVEEWNPLETMPRNVLTPPAGGSPMPDIPNWAWHEYGNRVGFWRMLELFDHLKIRAALAINGSAIHAYPPIAHAALERGWEFIGHGFGQKNMQKVPDERVDIVKTTEVIQAFTGRRPRGLAFLASQLDDDRRQEKARFATGGDRGLHLGPSAGQVDQRKP